MQLQQRPLTPCPSPLKYNRLSHPTAIKQQCKARIRHLLKPATTDKLRKIKTRAATAYDTCPKSSHRLLKIKCGMLPPNSSSSSLHRITKSYKTTATTPSAVLKAVHSHFATELSRATPHDLPSAPWELSDNPDNFTIEPRGDPSLTLADMMTRDTFDKTLNSLGTCKAPGPDGIPNEINQIPTPGDPLRPLFSPLPPRPHVLHPSRMVPKHHLPAT
jgi:hypothetical protein